MSFGHNGITDGRDGTPAALVPLCVLTILFFAPTLYVALDTALVWTDSLKNNAGDDTRDLKSIPLFILTLLWPAL